MEHKIFHIVAASGDAMVIGNENKLPWPKYPEDLKFFKATTSGSTVIMGRKTFESIGGKSLPNRANFVLSHSNLQVPSDVKVFNSLNDALKSAQTENVFIIGGADLYRQTMNIADAIYLTRVKPEYEGDTTYPKLPPRFKKNEEKTKELQEKYKIDIVYLENTGTA